MVEFRWIKTSLFLVLQFTATTRQLFLSFTVRVEDEATLSCENVKADQNDCDSTSWVFSDSRRSPAVELVKLGQIGENAGAKSDRLSVLGNCSLVIKKVTGEDVGRYTCRQFNKEGQQEGRDAVVLLSVVTMTEHTDDDQVTLNCSLSTYERCRHTVKWLYEGKDVDEHDQGVKTTKSPCNVSVTFLTYYYMYTLRSESLTCEVTDGDSRDVFPFRARPSGEDTRKTTTQPPTTTTTTTGNGTSIKLEDLWWLSIVVPVVFVALLITVVAVVRWRKTKGNKTRMNDNVGLTSNPAETRSAAGTSQDTADADDGISYASVSYTKKSDSKAQVRRPSGDGEGDAVTYMAVRASSTDPSSLYATVK